MAWRKSIKRKLKISGISQSALKASAACRSAGSNSWRQLCWQPRLGGYQRRCCVFYIMAWRQAINSVASNIMCGMAWQAAVMAYVAWHVAASALWRRWQHIAISASQALHISVSGISIWQITLWRCWRGVSGAIAGAVWRQRQPARSQRNIGASAA